mmetsp:Transcript_76373/g.210897  ORF Transcript_76373/g.210897 Transcript_76373/m.210897 type:complete len:200 (+) Transcript_76373:620-1219(+)
MSSMMSPSKNLVRASARQAATMSAGPLRPHWSHFCKEGASSIIRPKLCTWSSASALTSTSSSSFFSSAPSSAPSCVSPAASPSSDSESIQANSFFLRPVLCPLPAASAGSSVGSMRAFFSSTLSSAFASKRLPRSSSSFAAAHFTVAFLFVLATSEPAPMGRVLARDVCILQLLTMRTATPPTVRGRGWPSRPPCLREA